MILFEEDFVFLEDDIMEFSFSDIDFYNDNDIYD
jgi:hypothetical protein